MEESFAVVTDDDSTPIKNEYLCVQQIWQRCLGMVLPGETGRRLRRCEDAVRGWVAGFCYAKLENNRRHSLIQWKSVAYRWREKKSLMKNARENCATWRTYSRWKDVDNVYMICRKAFWRGREMNQIPFVWKDIIACMQSIFIQKVRAQFDSVIQILVTKRIFMFDCLFPYFI